MGRIFKEFYWGEDIVQDDWTPEEVDTVRSMLRRLVQRGASYLTKQAQEEIKHLRYVATAAWEEWEAGRHN